MLVSPIVMSTFTRGYVLKVCSATEPGQPGTICRTATKWTLAPPARCEKWLPTRKHIHWTSMFPIVWWISCHVHPMFISYLANLVDFPMVCPPIFGGCSMSFPIFPWFSHGFLTMSGLLPLAPPSRWDGRHLSGQEHQRVPWCQVFATEMGHIWYIWFMWLYDDICHNM